MPPNPGMIRRVEIVTLSARQELITVARTAMAVGAATWLYLAVSPFAFSGAGSARGNLLPYQSLVQDRSADDQRMFRELQVALIEAEGLRSASKEWPAVSALAAEGIEPFAPNPALKDSRYAWRLARDGRFINYLGIAGGTTQPPTPQGAAGGAGTPAWLILIQEPDPAAPEPFLDDEDHDRLADGSVLHVSIWMHPTGGPGPANVLRAPQVEGWIQLYATSAPTTHAIITSPPAP